MGRSFRVVAICLLFVLSGANPGTAVIANDQEVRGVAVRCENTVPQRAGAYSQSRVIVSTFMGLEIQAKGTIQEHALFWECMLNEYNSKSPLASATWTRVA
jgi:hypothetical protein